MDLSVVIPVHNEAENIGGLLQEIHDALEYSCEFEIVVVNHFCRISSLDFSSRRQKVFPILGGNRAVNDWLGIRCELTIPRSDIGAHELVAAPTTDQTRPDHFTAMRAWLLHAGRLQRIRSSGCDARRFCFLAFVEDVTTLRALICVRKNQGFAPRA